jgi:Ca2+/H+ antiporter, TMEM165/GDT1 family
MRTHFAGRHFYGWRLVFIPVFAAIAMLLFTWIVMALWNAILPVVFGIKAITLIQALGILILSKILFGGIHGGCRSRHSHMHEWKNKWMQMTDEEKARMREEWRNRCHYPKEEGKTGV